MPLEIINYKTITLSNLGFNTEQKWSANINVEFPVDEVVIKWVALNDANVGDPPRLTNLRSTLINNHVIFSYPAVNDSFYEVVNTPFKLHGVNINGIYVFTFEDGTSINPHIIGFDTHFSMVLLFIQYGKSKYHV